MTGIYEASKKRGFTDCSTEMFYVDYIEPGQPKKAPPLQDPLYSIHSDQVTDHVKLIS